jgi:superfamily I DNA and RNA helicase
LTANEVEALSPHEGEMPDPIVYQTPERVAPCTVEAVQRCLQRGFALEDIAIVSMRGRERSVLQGLESLGSWPLRRFTGRFDDGGSAIWADGTLLIDSVRRFKGQAAPAVVLTECDLSDLDPGNRRLLFVGLTRACVHLEWVISTQTAQMLQRTFTA